MEVKVSEVTNGKATAKSQDGMAMMNAGGYGGNPGQEEGEVRLKDNRRSVWKQTVIRVTSCNSTCKA